jgi:hypothetical protein
MYGLANSSKKKGRHLQQPYSKLNNRLRQCSHHQKNSVYKPWQGLFP